MVDPSRQLNRERVFFGATVNYADGSGAERMVTIVGTDEADMGAGKVSLMSPVATALIRAQARVGDEVAVHTPKGVATIEVLSVSYPGPAPLPKYGEGLKRNC